jgi:hypothetical protein
MHESKALNVNTMLRCIDDYLLFQGQNRMLQRMRSQNRVFLSI